MVEVEWDFEGGAVDRPAAEKAVGRVLAFYQQALAGISCGAHRREPWLKVKGPTLQTLVVSIEACCGDLLQRAKARVGGVSRRGDE
jgi:hypothetical protein